MVFKEELVLPEGLEDLEKREKWVRQAFLALQAAMVCLEGQDYQDLLDRWASPEKMGIRVNLVDQAKRVSRAEKVQWVHLVHLVQEGQLEVRELLDHLEKKVHLD